jgi:transposase-like protein
MWDLFDEQLNQGLSVQDVCDEMDIPKKNLKRWMELGAERKKGGGRK